MKQLTKILAITATLGLMAESAFAGPIGLFDWGINIDGSSTCSAPVPAGDPPICTLDGAVPGDLPGTVGTAGFDFLTGLGTITIDVVGAGAHSILAFFDHEIDESVNTFFNEFGTGTNVLEVGQSAEIDEPGFVFGDIYDNFLDNLLCNCTDLPDAASADDVSMAMGWDFTLAAGESAVVSFFLSDANGAGTAFFLTHHDLDSPDQVFFWGSLEITTAATGVPEPGTLMLFSLGLVGFGMAKKRKAA